MSEQQRFAGLILVVLLTAALAPAPPEPVDHFEPPAGMLRGGRS